MRESIAGTYLFQIVIVLLLLFTAYLCLSINYTSAYKVSDSIINQIQVDEGVNIDNISDILASVHYASTGDCTNNGKEDKWTGFDASGKITSSDEASFCIKKVIVSADSDELPDMFYYKVKVFYTISVPIISSVNLNVKGDTSVIYSPSDVLDGNLVTVY